MSVSTDGDDFDESEWNMNLPFSVDKYFNDTIIDKKTGYVVKFGKKKTFVEKLNSLSKNKKKLIELGINAKKNYDIRHNLKNNTKKLYKLYKFLT